MLDSIDNKNLNSESLKNEEVLDIEKVQRKKLKW